MKAWRILAESDGRVITSVIVHFMKKLSGGVLDKLWEGGGFVLSRTTLPDGPTPVLVLTPASERPAAGVIARLEHAFALREELDSFGVARPLRLVQYRGLPALPGYGRWAQTGDREFKLTFYAVLLKDGEVKAGE